MILLGAAFLGCALGCVSSARTGAGPSERSALPAIEIPKRDVIPEPLTFADPVLAFWLSERLPQGGQLVRRPDGSAGVVHRVQPDQTLRDVADAYVELTEAFVTDELLEAIREDNGLSADAAAQVGARLSIPNVIREVPKAPSDTRLGWPDDKRLRGLQVRARVVARKDFPQFIDKMATHKMNLIVLDVKDANGRITYPSNVALAREIGAVDRPPIHHLARVIQLAHSRGVRVAMRIVCFADDLLSRRRGDLAVQSVRRRPLYIGWLDPANELVQNYIIDLANEAMSAGADEIQLDYVRYPVEDVEHADFHLKERGLRRRDVIAQFVHRVHEATRQRGAVLSVDVFGIIAEGVEADIEHLGQDPGLLAKECEVIAPMVYPSHYPKGFMGFEEPGDHPELVRIGVSKLRALIKRRQPGQSVLIRPWLQGMPFRTPNFGPKYIADEVEHANLGGATGWMIWNPTQDYSATWQGTIPPKSERSP